jgi:hypothetical protein
MRLLLLIVCILPHIFHVCSAGSAPLVVISTTADAFYSFVIPLTTLLWTQLSGYEVQVIVATGESGSRDKFSKEVSAEERRVLALVTEAIQDFGGSVTVVDGGAFASQVGRPLAAAQCGGAGNAVADADARWILISDGDMWPVDLAYFESLSEPADGQVHALYANAYPKSDPPMYPMCYLAANCATWQRLLPGLTDISLDEAVAREWEAGEAMHGQRWHSASKAVSPQWFHDQHLVATRLAAVRAADPDAWEVLPRTRAPPRDRIDRARWPTSEQLAAAVARSVDAHLLRPGYTDDNWPRLRELLTFIVRRATSNDESAVVTLLESVDEYVASFREALGAEEGGRVEL